MAQKKINTHGYKMQNLREIAGMTKGMKAGTYHIEIAYEKESGKILYEEHVGTVGQSYVSWEDGIYAIGYLTKPTTQQEIADMIDEKMKFFYSISHPTGYEE